nr:MAG TPA: hypothetical protein [Caudoviricetes sp.]
MIDNAKNKRYNTKYNAYILRYNSTLFKLFN